MQTDWEYVKKTTLWQYEDLIKKLHMLTGYPVLWETYNHTPPEATAFARRLFPGSNFEAGEYPAAVLRTIEQLHIAGVSDWESLLAEVATRADCTAFVSRHDLHFPDFIDLLNYLLRWAFPFQTATRELLDHDSLQEMTYYTVLKKHAFKYSFDLLEPGRNSPGRGGLAELTGLPLGFVTALVHRADIARLPYVRRKTILAVCGAGYNTLAKIAAAVQPQMEASLDAYFRRTQGKSWENFKSVIVVKGLITGAQALPVIVEA